MARSYKARNKRIISRSHNGRFRKTTMQDFGIGGFCETCGHMMIRHYYGDPREAFPDPRKFRYRCFTCEPLTVEEKKLQEEIEASRPKHKTIIEFMEDAIKSCEGE